MDSATAFWYALRHSQVRVVLTLDYGQHGAALEVQAAERLVEYARNNVRLKNPIDHHIIRLGWPKPSCGLTVTDPWATDPDALHPSTEIPFTFVPGRTLIRLALATSYAFGANAEAIYGGWVAIDTPYPDCREIFLNQTELAIQYALGLDDANVNKRPDVEIVAPVLQMDKTEVVNVGTTLGVPWQMTRSCYRNVSAPCMTCDSCLKRMEAFANAGLRDPLVSIDHWERFLDSLDEGGIYG
jgi:7-cyano-7-deazaguanine synthase